MRPSTIEVVRRVRAQYTTQVSLSECDHVVETFSPASSATKHDELLTQQRILGQ